MLKGIARQMTSIALAPTLACVILLLRTLEAAGRDDVKQTILASATRKSLSRNNARRKLDANDAAMAIQVDTSR